MYLMKTLGLFLSFVKWYSPCDGKFSLTTAGWHRAPAEEISIHPDAETEKWKYLDERKEDGGEERAKDSMQSAVGEKSKKVTNEEKGKMEPNEWRQAGVSVTDQQ